jgi:hypothetical protein
MSIVGAPLGGTQRIRPSRWYAAIAVPVLFAGFFVMGYVLRKDMNKIAKTMARQTLPGSLQAQMHQGRTYTIFLEQSGSPPSASPFGYRCEVRTHLNGEPLKLRLPTAVTSYIVGRRRGLSIFEFDVSRDSTYLIACEVWDLPTAAGAAIAVGTGVKEGISSAILKCYFIGGGGVLLALLIFVRVLMLHDQSKREIRSRGLTPV